MSDVDRVPVLYIGGEGRSGSTVLSAMLGTREGFLPIGELGGLWQALKLGARCGCGESLATCDFWQRVGDAAFGGWDRVDVDAMFESDTAFARVPRLPRLLTARMRPREADRLATYRRAVYRLYRGVQEVSQCAVIVDSTKNPAYARFLRGIPGIDPSFVHLVRDSRGVAFSWAKHDIVAPDYANNPDLAGTFVTSQPPWKTAVRWDAVNVLFWLLTPSRRRVLVKYESVMTRQDEVERIVRLAGARRPAGDPIAPLDDFRPSQFHTVSGNPVRFKRGRLTLRVDDEWKTRMRRSQRVVVGALTFPLLLAYGYVGGRARRQA